MAKVAWKAFVNIALSSAEKDTIKADKRGTTQLWEAVSRVADSGYKWSLTTDYENDCYIVTLTGVDDVAGPNAGISMSQRHRDLLIAVRACLWVVENVPDWVEGEQASKLDW